MPGKSPSAREKEKREYPTLKSNKQLLKAAQMIEPSISRLSMQSIMTMTSMDPIPNHNLPSTPTTKKLILSPPSQIPRESTTGHLILNSHLIPTPRFPSEPRFLSHTPQERITLRNTKGSLTIFLGSAITTSKDMSSASSNVPG